MFNTLYWVVIQYSIWYITLYWVGHGHKACFFNYIRKFKISIIDVEANNFRIAKRKIFEKYHQLIRNILENGPANSLSDIRDLIKDG